MRRLLIRPGAIGDCIVSLPALESLRVEYTEVWTAGQNTPLIRFAGRVRSIADTGLDLAGIPGVEPPARLAAALGSFDSIVSWYGANRTDFRAAVAGLPFDFFPALPAAGAHAVDFFLAHARGLGGAAVEPVPRIPCPAAPRGNFAVIHPFASSARKTWPLENFREVAAALERKMPVRWCAGPGDALDNAVRIADLFELACWLASARVYIGNDSGIAHLAAAVGTPVVALFGPMDPAVWAPRGQAVRAVRHAQPAQALAAVESLLGGNLQ